VYVNAVTGKGTYYITSTGVDSLSGVAAGKGRRNYPSRTVGVFVTWNTMTMNVVGALVGLGGISKNGTGQVSGVDECGKKSSVAGVSTPTGEMNLNGNSFTPTGSPPFDTLNTFSAESASLKLDWAGVKAGTTMQADITVPASAFPDYPQFSADTNYWPVIHVTDLDYTLPNKGRGLLIIDGDLTINGSDQWDGVILIGGKLISNGNNVMSGTVMTGLNYLLTGPPSGLKNPSVDNSEANGQKSYQYNSCSIDKATSSMARYSIIPNSWMDNVAGF
jgi:hypothetical protein